MPRTLSACVAEYRPADSVDANVTSIFRSGPLNSQLPIIMHNMAVLTELTGGNVTSAGWQVTLCDLMACEFP